MNNGNLADIKQAANGRWSEILPAVLGWPAERVDGRNQSCPMCGGTDRFRFSDLDGDGSVFCNQCHRDGGDGFAAIMWALGIGFPAAKTAVADYLGMGQSDNGKPTGRALGWDDEIGGKPAANGKPRIVKTYDYRDEAGDLLFQVCRYEPKTFRQRKPKPGGGWSWSVKGVRTMPYRLPELLAAPSRHVFVVEGEKDCDGLASIGLLATCNAGGAGKWTAEHAKHLAGRGVVILPDNDGAGRKHAEQVAASLQGLATWIRIVNLPSLPEKGDVSDWLAAGGTKEQLVDLVQSTAEWKPSVEAEPEPSAPIAGPVLTCLADVEPRAIRWLWDGRFPLGRVSLLVGRPGEGKSFLTTDMAARVTTGTPWPDGSYCPQGSVILISAEDDPRDTIRPRLDAHRADVRKVYLLSAVRRVTGTTESEKMITLADVDAVEEAIKQLDDCKLLAVDPIGSFLGNGVDAHRDNEVRSVLAPIAMLAEKYGPAVLVVAHRRKGGGLSADDNALGSRAFTGLARAVWHLSRDPGDKSRRLLLPGKNNLAHEGDGLAFSIVGEPARLAWETDPVAMTADDGLAAEQATKRPGPDAEAQDAAVAWLSTALADGPRPAKDLFDEWKNGQGGSKRTLERAKQVLGVEAYREGVPGPWLWRLLDFGSKVAKQGCQDPKDKEPGDLGNLAENTGVLPLFENENPKDAKLSELGNLGDRERFSI